MENRIAIYGAGGFGREVLQIIFDINSIEPTWSCAGFVVDKEFLKESEIKGLPVLGSIEWLEENPETYIVIAVGSSAARWRITQNLRQRCKNTFAVLVHPLAWIGKNVEIGAGSIICAGALITTDIKISRHVQINIGSTVGHDAVLGDFVTLNPSVNISGNVNICEGAEIGTGSVVIPSCNVGEWSIVGAGSIVTKSVKNNCTVVGSPARIIKERVSGWQRALSL